MKIPTIMVGAHGTKTDLLVSSALPEEYEVTLFGPVLCVGNTSTQTVWSPIIQALHLLIKALNELVFV